MSFFGEKIDESRRDYQRFWAEQKKPERLRNYSIVGGLVGLIATPLIGDITNENLFDESIMRTSTLGLSGAVIGSGAGYLGAEVHTAWDKYKPIKYEDPEDIGSSYM